MLGVRGVGGSWGGGEVEREVRGGEKTFQNVPLCHIPINQVFQFYKLVQNKASYEDTVHIAYSENSFRKYMLMAETKIYSLKDK